MFEIIPVRAFSDNYIWTLIKDDEVTVVDPGDSGPVKEFLKDKALNLKNILICLNLIYLPQFHHS